MNPNSKIIGIVLISLLCFRFAPGLRAQDQPAASQSEASTAEYPIMMSEFQVNSTENKGYITKNSASAFKTDQALLTIPQAVMVVTRDLISDTGYTFSSDVLRFAGVAAFFRGESFELRGTRLGYDLIDELPNIQAYLDNVFVDSYEVIRGPAAVFYPTAALGGIILKTSRKPLDYNQNTFNFSEDQWGLYRAELDSTGPLAKLGTGLVSYRLLLAGQSGKMYFYNMEDNVKAIHPSLQWANGQNRVLVAGDFQEIISPPNGQAFIDPQGKIVDAAGKRWEANVPEPQENTMRRYTALRIQFQHHIGTNWEMKLYGRLSESVLRTSNVQPGGPNFVNDTTNWSLSATDGIYKTYDLLGDFTGTYNLFGLNARSTFGYTAFREFNINYSMVPPPGYPTSWNNIPFSQPNANYVKLPTLAQWTVNPIHPLANGGTTFDFTAYYNQDLEIIPDRLSGVAGVSWRYIESDSTTGDFISLGFPFNETSNVLSVPQYRVGVVYQLIKKQLALYGMKSTISSSNGTNLGTNGQPLPAAQGIGSEAGIKADILDGKITTTASVYDIEKTNVAVVTSYTSSGVPLYALYGKTVQKGWDTDVTYMPIPDLQLVATFQQGSVETQAGLPVANAYRGMWSVFGKYIFPKSSGLRGLQIGGGASEIHGLLEGVSGTLTPAQTSTLVGGAYIQAKAAVLANAFANYAINKHWTVSVMVDNILNENFVQGAQNSEYVDPSPPLTVSARVAFKY